MKGKPKKRQVARILAWCGIVLFSLGILFAGYMLYTKNIDYYTGGDAYKKLRLEAQTVDVAAVENAPQATVTTEREDEAGPAAVVKPPYVSPINFTELTAVNSDVKAWLLSEGTVIDYPVVLGTDNEFYMDHLYTKEKNKMGCLFMDYRNTGDFTDKNTVIYGHHMRSGAMFASITAYKDQEYYELLPSMTLYVPGGQAKIELFAGVVEDGDYEFVKFQFDSDEAFLSYVSDLRARSTFSSSVEVQPDDRLVTLCTCTYDFENARYALIGRLVWL